MDDAIEKRKTTSKEVVILAGEEGFEPSAYGFGDRRSAG